jgi:2-succinyl-5-enolpyruvyl-6-hydroxy-3-cyclohexene-1-carboxylate synthase
VSGQSAGQTLAVAALLDELAQGGVRHAVVSPGSRSTPLAVLAAEHGGLTVWLNIDERSAGFFALGLAKATREPVALICTSGTAAANYWPAVAEASLARVPLVVLTADRPHELRDVGAPQTILQAGMYGRHVKWDFDLPVPDGTAVLVRHARTVAARAVATAREAPMGPVHLNVPLREPLLPDLALPRLFEAERGAGRPGIRVTAGRRLPDEGRIAGLARELAGVRRGLIVCGPMDEPGFSEAVADLARRLAWPLLADPLSQLRSGEGAAAVIDAYDAFLRDGRTAEALKPEAVLRFGAMPVSKAFQQYVERHRDCRHLVVDAGGWREPTLSADEMVHADPVLFCRHLAAALDERNGRGARPEDGGTGPDGGQETGPPEAPSADWLGLWRRINRETRAVLERAGREQAGEPPFEGRVFLELRELLPPGAALVVGNSMPVRDLDAFFGSRPEPVRIAGNRGANGIDGLVSTALGFSAAGIKTVLVIGDLSFYHDMNGLLMAKRCKLDLTVVLVNNDGGGIFSFLSQAALDESRFEALFGTPTGLDFAHAARLYGGEHARPADWDGFRRAFADAMDAGGLRIIEVRTDRAANVEQHRRAWRAVAERLAGIL